MSIEQCRAGTICNKSSHVDALLEKSLENERLRSLARLSVSGAIIYPTLFVVLKLTTSIKFVPSAGVAFLIVCLAAIARITVAKRILGSSDPSQGNYKLILRTSVIALALGWSLFSAVAVVTEGHSTWNALFLMLITTGLGAGGASSLEADKHLAAGFVFCLWVTHTLTYLVIGDWATGLVATLYCGYLGIQIKRQSAILTESILGHHRLRQKTEELETASLQAKTAQAETQRFLKLAKDALNTAEEADAAKGQFLATISHEIRTPLHGVLGMNTLLRDSKLTEEQREYSDGIRRSGEALLALINDVLDFSKMEAGSERLFEQDFRLEETLSQAEQMVKHNADKKGLTLRRVHDEHLPERVHGDMSKIRQVISNLLSNAVKFTDQGEIVLEAKLKHQADDTYHVQLSVSDTGIGVPLEHQQDIFEPFTQANSSTTRTREGSGLGLAISRHLAHLLKGSLSVDSTEGEGSTFTLLLPLEAARSEPSVEFQPNLSRLTIENAESKRILVAEDNPTNQKILKRLLRKSGCQCTVVENGKLAVEAVQKEDFDLVLMDCHMPEMDGYEATRKILALKPGAPPIIAVTANASDENQRLCRESGMVDFLSKPVNLSRLQKALNKAF